MKLNPYLQPMVLELRREKYIFSEATRFENV